MVNEKNTFRVVYKVVRKIPAGKVMTYGQISSVINDEWQMTNNSNRITPRVVGWALHANRDPKIPCHRVVNREGRLAENFAFNGADEQRSRLKKEGVVFKDGMHVDLEKHMWKI
jgi:methylated-DNA-protein-cysteine methyltransferase-like protein